MILTPALKGDRVRHKGHPQGPPGPQAGGSGASEWSRELGQQPHSSLTAPREAS